MARLPQTSTSLLRYLRAQKRVTTRLANASPYALSGTSVAAEGVTVIGTPGGSRLELVGDGLRKYAADGTTVQVDMTGPTAVFSGIVTGSEIIGGILKTAASGNRIQIDAYANQGQLEFFTGHPDEYTPGTIRAAVLTGSPGYEVVSLAVFPPQLGSAYCGLDFEIGEHDTDSALDYAQVTLEATDIFLTADTLSRSIDMIETFKGPLPSDLWGALRFYVVDSSLPWNDPGSLVELLARAATPTVAAPLLVWDTNAAPGQELQYTTDGTTWTVIGGGGSGGPLFADPNADRLVFWDDSVGAFAPLTASTGLTLTGTDLTVRDATDALMGGVVLATPAAAIAGLDTTTAVTPAGVRAAIGAPTVFAVMASDQANSTVTPASVTALETVTEAGTYLVKYWVCYRAAETTTGIEMFLDHSGTVTRLASTWYTLTTGGAAATGIADQASTLTAQVMEGKGQRAKNVASGPMQGVDTAAADQFAVIEGLLIVTVSGTLKLMFRSEVAASAVTMMTGTTLTLTKVA